MSIENLFQRGLSLDKLRSFLAVVRAGSVTGAAAGEPSRRSLMSRQISELESTLGMELFLRQGKSLRLTEAGRELALLTASYFSEFGNLVKRSTTGESLLRIGAGASTFDAVVFPRIQMLREQLRDVQFEFISADTAGILRSLRQGELDVGIIRVGEHGADLLATPCGRLDYVLVGRVDFDRNLPDWGLAKFLNRVPLAMIRGAGAFVSSFHHLCSEIDASPQVMIRTESFDQVRQMMMAGYPGGILPRQLADTLPVSDFHIIEDPALARLTRELAVVIDSRVARLKDRLPGIANLITKVIKF
jgi:DNA-binding transcriptional LysR family regulator